MKLCFVLDQLALSGGVKVVLQLATLAGQLGHQVEVHGIGPMPDWAHAYFSGTYQDRRETQAGGQFDLAIATYYTTVDAAEALHPRRVVHFCQGYEGAHPFLADQHPRIDSIYRRKLPAFVVNPALGPLLSTRFAKPWRFVPPPIDPIFQPRRRLLPRRKPRIVIPGTFEAPSKGVETCIRAVQELRSAGMPVTVSRYSLLQRCASEKELLADSEFIHGVSPNAIAEHLRGADLLVQGVDSTEGFGLHAMEAMLSGVPVICTDLPAARLLGVPRQHRVAVGDHHGMARAARALLQSRTNWRHTRQSNLLRVRTRFADQAILRRLRAALAWAISFEDC